MKKVCSHCGKEYQTPSPFSRFCSGACRQAAYRRRKGTSKGGRDTARIFKIQNGD